MISLLKKWVNIHSGTKHLSGLQEMLSELKEAFSVLEGEMEEIALPSPLGHLLSITKHPNAKTQILLTGHMDIALPPESPLEEPHWKGEDILVGRGSADMKGGLLVMLLALQRLEESSCAGKVGWRIIINPDEEIGSPGSTPLFTQIAKDYNIGLIFEPSFDDGAIVSSRKGSANYTVNVQGVASHAGRDFHSGHNAITSAARFMLEAESLTDISKEITVNIGQIQGGGPVNIVPDKAVCRLNVRVKESEDLHRVKETLKRIAERESQRKGIKITLEEDSMRPPKPFDTRTKKLFELLRKCAKELGTDLKWKPSGGVCDGNTLSAAGLPTIDTLGVIGGKLHTAEEYAVINSIEQRAELAARFMMQIAEGKI